MAENNRSYVEISNYLYNYKTLKDTLKMKKAEDWQFFGEESLTLQMISIWYGRILM